MTIISTDHKVVARQFLWAGLIFLLIGGGLAMVMRWQWAYPGRPLPLLGPITPAEYTTLFSNHGLIMIFFAITPVLIGALGNFCIPLMIGARDMAFPRLNAASFWLFLASQITVLVSLGADVAASAGWTMYPPLSTGIGTPGWGQSAMLVAIFLAGMASLLGAINYITTVIVARAAGVSYMKLPLTVWGLFLTAILNALFVPVLAAAAMLSFGDRVFGTEFFAAATGDPTLYQHLFWIFGHPEVYILILPVWGVLGDLIAFFSGKPANWYRGSVFAMIAVTVLSGLVYGHHLYQTGLGPLAGKSFEALTLAISAPAVVLFINWLLTLWGGAVRLTVPMVLCLGTLLVFGAGGLTGLYLGAITPDIALHDSLFVVGHFHLIMAAATFLGSLAALTFWFPRMFGRELGRKLGMVHAVLTVVLLAGTFGMLLASGYAGQPRRYYDPFQIELFAGLRGVNKATSHMAFTLGAVQLLFVVNWFWSLWRGERVRGAPWGASPLPYDLADADADAASAAASDAQEEE